jgi:hypothetical protein
LIFLSTIGPACQTGNAFFVKKASLVAQQQAIICGRAAVKRSGAVVSIDTAVSWYEKNTEATWILF